jgi:L-glutamine:2-deoxy-scyllo-inosose/3-amino-2,3-dideoxy-scyllo-inosose aminotransferase
MSKLAVRGGKPIRTKPWPSWPEVGPKEVDLVSKVVASGNWSFDGPIEAKFARKWADYLGAKHCLLVANGSVSLEIALRALDVYPGDEVIVPPTTWFATATSVINIGAVPVFADIELDTFCIDPIAIEKAVTKKTKAIIPVHAYGCMADMDGIMKIARKYKLKVLEDCAHTHGSMWKGKGAGAIGDVGSFSFQQSKVLTSGEGGCVTTNSDELARRMYSIKNCGRVQNEGDTHMWGNNFRITEFQAAILMAQFARFPAQTKKRHENAIYLDSLLSQIPGVKAMRRRKQITQQAHYMYTFRVDLKQFAGATLPQLMEALRAEGIPVGSINGPVYSGDLFPTEHPSCPYSHKPAGRRFDYKNLNLPNAEKAFHEVGISVYHPALLTSKKDVKMIADAVAKVQANAGELK